MTIAEVSKEYDLTPDTLRYYERIGLICNVPRNKSGIRNYDEKSCKRIEFIKCMRNAGVEIKILEKLKIQPTLINPRYITGIDKELLEKLKENHDIVITLEDWILDGGFGEKIARFYGDTNIKVKNYGIAKEFYDRYDVNELLKDNRLTKEQIVEDLRNLENI